MTPEPALDFSRYLGRAYDAVRYNCLHFSRDVILDHKGVDIEERLAGLFDPATRHLRKGHFDAFVQLSEPEDFCLVFLSPSVGSPHVGVYAHGRVLHLSEAGARCQSLESLRGYGFRAVRYYRC